MADQFDALVGGVPQDPRSQQALIAALRQQNLMGMLAASTGDRALGPLGQMMSKQAEGGAQDIGSLREREANSRQTLTFHQDELQHQDAALKEQMREHNQSDQRMKEATSTNEALRRDMLQQTLQARADLEAQKAADKANAPGKPIPETALAKIELTKNSLAGVDNAIMTLKKLDAAGIETGGLGRSSKDWLASSGVANLVPGSSMDDLKAVQNFNASYQRAFTFPEMKDSIGLRHNQYMQELFERNHITPNMSNADKMKNLLQIRDQVYGRASRSLVDHQKLGYNVNGQEDYLPGGALSHAPLGDTPDAPPSKATQYLNAAKAGGAAPPAAPPMGMPQPQMPMQSPSSSLFPLSQKIPGVPDLTGGNMMGGLGGR